MSKFAKCAEIPVLELTKTWLQEEVETWQGVVDGAEVLSDGTGDICKGRYECAKNLLIQIDKWEKLNPDQSIIIKGGK